MAWLNDTIPSGVLPQADIDAYGAPEAAMRRISAYLCAWVALQPLATRDRVITWQDKGTVEQDIIQAMQALGISVMILFKGGVRKSSFKNALMLNPARFEISILEKPKVNRTTSGTNMSCGRVAAEVAMCLSGMPLAQGQIEIDDWSTPDNNVGQQIVIPFHTALLVSAAPVP